MPARRLTLMVSLMTGVALLVSACGKDDSSATSTSAAAVATPGSSTSADVGEHNDADVMFATMMVPHHAQAIEMAEAVLAKDGISPAVRELADGIRQAQGPEIAMMQEWLAAWGQPPAPTAAGDHAEHDMPGGMSDADVAALEAASGAAADRLFLEQMIVHHAGAIEMADAELAAGDNAEATALARKIIRDQRAEIELMKELLADAAVD